MDTLREVHLSKKRMSRKIIATVAIVATFGITSVAAGCGGASGDAAAGEQVYANNCATCHAAKGEGGANAGAPKLAGRGLAADTIKTKVNNGGGAMPAFKGKLSDTDIANVAAFVSGMK